MKFKTSLFFMGTQRITGNALQSLTIPQTDQRSLGENYVIFGKTNLPAIIDIRINADDTSVSTDYTQLDYGLAQDSVSRSMALVSDVNG
ncbi:MAG: hypothetical protein K2Y19_17965, partial [Afipia birgiae]|nr:hypothetical protein [Afipia birgiae]